MERVKDLVYKLKNFSGLDYMLVRRSKYFNELWYKRKYKVFGDGALHYCKKGYKLGYSPSNKFSHIKYELIYDEVRAVKANPLAHYERFGKYESLFSANDIIRKEDLKKIKEDKKKQDKQILKDYSKKTKNLIVFLVPEIDMIGGGVMSINSIANISKQFKDIHNSDVILCTMPSERTFFNYSKFKADFNIYRFDQLKKYFKKLENVIFHIPEIYVHPFLYFLTPEQQFWLKSIKNSRINILNQNMEFMPRPRYVNDYLKNLFGEITMTCAHKQYCIPQLRTSYDVSVHFLSASNLVKYKYLDYSKKENLLLYSPDDHPMKELILQKIKNAYPDLVMKEIRNMKYQDYLTNIGKAKWMITFGEGLDGYFAESLRSGTMAFAAYNPIFFNNKFKGLENIYLSYNQMYENIVDDMKALDVKNKYEKIVKKCIDIDKVEYDDKVYIENIKKYYQGDYTYPISDVLEKRKKLLESKPLISIAVATYNGEKYIKEQIDSLLALSYPNKEIIVSDDGSVDNTYKILKEYGDKIVLLKNDGKHGLNGNFANALKKCNGEYIALCDQDDIWESNKLELLLEHIDEFDLIHGGVSIIDADSNYHPLTGMHTVYEVDKTRYYNFVDFIKENMVLGCTCLMKRDFLLKYLNIPDEVIYHDWWLVLNALKHGNGIVYVDKEVIKYRQHDTNTAFKTFNSFDWYDKKIKFNNYILDTMKLEDGERDLVNIDNNCTYLRKVFKKYIPTSVDSFFKDNYNYFIDDFVDELNREINKYKNDKK